MRRLVRGHHQPILHQPNEKEAKNIHRPIRIVLEHPEFPSQKRIRRKHMQRSMQIALILAEFSDLLPQIDIVP